MAETERTFAELQVLLADQSAKAISPQDLRDAVVTALGGYASLYVDGGVAAQALTAVMAKVDAWAGVGPQRGDSASHADNEVTCAVGGDRLVVFCAQLTAGVSTTVDFELRLNGVKVTGATTRCAAGSSPVACSFASVVTVGAGQKLSVYAACTPDASVTLRNAQLVEKRAG